MNLFNYLFLFTDKGEGLLEANGRVKESLVPVNSVIFLLTLLKKLIQN